MKKAAVDCFRYVKLGSNIGIKKKSMLEYLHLWQVKPMHPVFAQSWHWAWQCHHPLPSSLFLLSPQSHGLPCKFRMLCWFVCSFVCSKTTTTSTFVCCKSTSTTSATKLLLQWTLWTLKPQLSKKSSLQRNSIGLVSVFCKKETQLGWSQFFTK